MHPRDGPVGWVSALWIRVLSREYEHCQLVFAWTEGVERPLLATFSTNKDLPSAYTSPSYTNDNWEALPIVSANVVGPEGVARRAALWRWCAENHGAPFNNWAYCYNFTPPILCMPCLAYDAEGTAFFCAEQVASALQQTDMPEGQDLVPHRCVPADIYAALTAFGATRAVLKRPEHVFSTPASGATGTSGASSWLPCCSGGDQEDGQEFDRAAHATSGRSLGVDDVVRRLTME
jgi:hypothetical protein